MSSLGTPFVLVAGHAGETAGMASWNLALPGEFGGFLAFVAIQGELDGLMKVA
jgi:hypothetical protein